MKASRNDSSRKHVERLIDSAENSKWAYEKIAAFWNDRPNPADYGATMGKWVPDFEFAHHVLLETVALTLPANARILELGAGSGRVSQMLLDCFPDCHVTLTDISPNMLAGASQRLAAYEGRFETIVGDFFNPAFTFEPAAFDCAVSFFAICHSRAVEQVGDLYQRVAHAIRPAGCFISHDHVLGATPKLTAQNATTWYDFMIANGLSAEDADYAILTTYQEDFPLTLVQHLALLADAGFQNVDVPYKRGLFGMVVGYL